ncbi:ABC transporter substrate-binding protein [Nakamurella flavida]|uniref:ABC transporter substrate-binding protein n=1 Tax=Nakamurella flavida TaxID=363630 RepID=A0A938YFZ1_9ACTN|nr:ABC transporter substrate-binding protein [Nakamurella flavida]MBM9475192.1 ABC transporter substrate-binding protein [Nakamurella flavida]MDP9776765.1 peptide/nickel transport system substrate-binding protein [Nakamurella flavida]
MTPRTRYRFHPLVAAAITALTVLAGCSAGSSVQEPTAGTTAGSSGSASPPAPADASLAIGFVLEPGSLDFTQADGAAIPQVLLDNVYETLVSQDQSGAIVPKLAESWTVSPDGLTYTFQLRSGVTFSDGAPFTAQDAAFSIDRVKADWKPAVKAGMDVVASAVATSDTELTVTLTEPSNSWLFRMTTRIGAMFSRTGVADLATTPIGTGPYAFGSWNRGEQIVLTRNPTYWGTPAALATATFRYFQDPAAMDNAMLTGGIQVISAVQTPESLAQFADTTRYQVIEGTTNGEVMMAMNNGRAPLSDVRVRQAISYALDRQQILDGAWSGYGSLIGGHEAPTDPWFTDLTGVYPHDVAKARALLAEAGQSDLRLTLKLPPVPYAQAAGAIVVSQLAEAGITVEASSVTFPVWLDQVFGQADYDLTIVNHVEPRDISTIFGDPAYYTRYDNAQVRDLFAAGDAGTPEEYVADYRAAMETITQDAAAAWLWSFPNLVVADASVRGLPQNAIGESFDLTTVSVG